MGTRSREDGLPTRALSSQDINRVTSRPPIGQDAVSTNCAGLDHPQHGCCSGSSRPPPSHHPAANLLPRRHQRKKTLEAKYPDYPALTEAEDPGMNGGYVNPPFIKRQHRDPYGNWWDKQERRNFGEPVHEDHDLLGIFSPYEYTWTTAGPGALMIGTFVATFLVVVGAIYVTYPDRPTFPREFENGLQRELGGASALRARQEGDEDP
ncbi:hypothetical protein HYQ45_008855 [Verticillium longisporum]|uniref:Uncharacterized protein n=1 Tax=Verticillium longisporum TaxID=100787 RepID=A0A8I2ZJI7_VERLO|nr:hypothetical protein HYQ45_008855 [Verticillium longisporum]